MDAKIPPSNLHDNGDPSRVESCFFPSDGRMVEPGQTDALPGQNRAMPGQSEAAVQTGGPNGSRPPIATPNGGNGCGGVVPAVGAPATLIGNNVSNSSRSHAGEIAARQRALGKMDAAERQAILDLKALQSAKIRVLETMRTLKRGSYYADRRARLQERIDALVCELAQLDSEYVNADAIIEQTQREVAAIGVRIKYAEHAHEIARVKDLVAKVNALKGETDGA